MVRPGILRAPTGIPIMSVAAKPPILLAPEVREALHKEHPVVCLESAVVTHGLPHPANAQAVWRAARAVRQAGAVCATVGVLDGKVKVGLSDDELRYLGGGNAEVRKLGVRDLATAMVRGQSGGTTVSATLWVASRIGARVVATGGVGGVHRDAPWDVSSDLTVLSQAPVALVSAGPKAILDLRATLERLETLAVPVVGLGTDELPGFYFNDTGIPLDERFDDEADIARVFRAHRALERKGGLLVTCPVPEAAALTRAEVEPVIEEALANARAAGVRGKALTPRLLEALRDALGERVLAANLAILEANASAAARLAIHTVREVPGTPPGLEGA